MIAERKPMGKKKALENMAGIQIPLYFQGFFIELGN